MYVEPVEFIEPDGVCAPLVPVVEVAVDVDPDAVVVEDEPAPGLAFVSMKRSAEPEVEPLVEVVAAEPVVLLVIRSACCKHPVTVIVF
jgi:hypothetical protein